MWMYCYGNATQLRKYADDLDVLSESNRKVFMERATISEDELAELMDAETYLTPDKALEYGLIDEIMDKREDDEPASVPDPNVELQKLRRQLNEQQSFREQLQIIQGSVKEKDFVKTEVQNKILEIFKDYKV